MLKDLSLFSGKWLIKMKDKIRKLDLIVILAVLYSCNGQNSSISQEETSSGVYTKSIEAVGIVYFSENNGLTWVDKSEGLPGKATLGTGALVVSGNNLGLATKEHGIYLYDFQAELWINLPTDKEIIQSNLGPLALFKGQIYIGTQLSGVYFTSDRGNTWTQINGGLADLTVRKLVPVNNTLYAGTNGGLYSFNQELQSWELEYGNGPLQVNGITEFDGSIYIGTNQGAFVKSDGQGEWRSILDQYSIHNLSSDDKTIYAMAYNTLFSSVDKGHSWQSLQEGLPRDLYTFAVMKHGNSVFAGQWDGVYRKDNESDAWKASSHGLPGNLSITNMALCKDILVASGNVRGLKQGMTTDKKAAHLTTNGYE